MNLVTKCCVTLPKCPSDSPHLRCGVALGYDSRTKKYKVVHVYADLFGFEIFTIGGSDNEWKRVCGPWKDAHHERPFDLDFYWSDPILTNERFMHWFVDSDDYFYLYGCKRGKILQDAASCWLWQGNKQAQVSFDGV
ncbi:hypothetical protein RHGRI_015390 [Rhododendron griersonianum]|uniref:S-protein homolog n=1 Tax=Rhododendron griersonianum TaxID=479676 RepID=A0AAV6KDN1_9ERIC|nr:hypothetical protein RHGRI_015390 [Rhododendron griersonianum]